MRQFLFIILMLLAQQVFGQHTLAIQPHWNGEDCTLEWMDSTNPSLWLGSYRPYAADSPGYNWGEIDYMAWTFGGDPGLCRGFIRFTDLSNPAVLPSHIRLVSATLKLKGVSTSGSWGSSYFPGSAYTNTNEGWLYELKDSFNAITVTWHTQPQVKHNDSVTIPVSTSRWNDSATLDVTAMVKDMLLNGNTGFELRTQVETFYRAQMFASSRYSDSTRHPALILVYYIDRIQDTITCNTATFTSTDTDSAIKSYKWYFGDGSTDTGKYVSHAYDSNGTYHVRLIATDTLGARDTLTDSVVIRVLPMNYNITDSIFNCTEVKLTAVHISGDTSKTYTWSLGDGSTGSGISIIHNYLDTTNYTISLLLVNSQGCSDTVYKSIAISPPAMRYSIDDSSIGCMQRLFVATKIGAENAVKYLWDLGDGTTYNANPTTHTYSKAGTYNVSLVTTNSNGCTDTLNTSVTLLPPNMHYNITDSATSCKSAMIMAVYDSGEIAANYKWYFGDGNIGFVNPISHIYPGGGNYVISLVVTDSLGCSDSISTPLHLNGYITIKATGDTSVCADVPVQLHVYGASTYSWLPPYSLSDPNQSDPIAKTDSTTKYIVTGTDDNGCTGKDSVMITIMSGPTLSLSTNGAIITCSNKVVQLFATGAQSYIWQPGIYCDDSTSSQPIVSPNHATTFYVTGTGPNGCTSKSSINVPANRQPDVFMPSAFTPNGDGKNDIIRPIIYCDFIFGSLHIYNRWGQEVFETKTYGEGWDGRFYGAPCEVGTYYYYIKGTTENGDPIMLKGDITLIR